MKSVLFLTFFIEAVILLQYANRLFLPKRPVSIRLLFLCSLYVFLYAASLWNIKWLNMGLYLIANFLFLVTQYHIRYRVAAFHSTLLAAVMSMCELTIYNIIARTAPNFYFKIESFHNTVLFILCSKVLFFAVIYLTTHIFKIQQQNEEHSDKSLLLLIFIPVTSVFIMLTFVNINDNVVLTSWLNWMVSLSGFFILLMNLLVFGIYQYNLKKNREYTEVHLLLQKESDFAEYYRMLLSQSENQKILIHDIKKHLQSILTLNEQNAPEKVDAYIRQLLLSSDLKETARICDNELLNVLFARAKRQCDDKGIHFSTDIRSGVLTFMSDGDLTSLFGNLLDNAMEAADGIPDSYIEINICKRENTPFVLITVVNSCRRNPFLNAGSRLSTTKPDKQAHGFGIKSIRKVSEKYHGDIQMYYNDNTLTFHTVITLRD